MSYTIVGLFPEHKQAELAAEKLSNEGFSSEDYHISKFSTNIADEAKDYSADDHPHFHFHESEKTTGFWNWLFGDEEHAKKKYSFAGSKNNIVTVFADNLENAEKARNILNEQGAINVHDETKEYIAKMHPSAKAKYEIDEAERARIINKAKNNLYFTNERSYTIKHEGMDSDMDSQGSKDVSV
ncbi:hypothetical protein SAMN05421847_2078 [Halpernia humi]|uniref:Heat induced stress protein YflT n=1 Tax=Halpernia humi TaxID=493375 RepID=A0A1H5ZLE5_9FLAO|nr:hypothetical protein [Halpernia humi]SEG37051.1 hypothetical protein SAMN05421847_2078 [Halpernia humi]